MNKYKKRIKKEIKILDENIAIQRRYFYKQLEDKPNLEKADMLGWYCENMQLFYEQKRMLTMILNNEKD